MRPKTIQYLVIIVKAICQFCCPKTQNKTYPFIFEQLSQRCHDVQFVFVIEDESDRLRIMQPREDPWRLTKPSSWNCHHKKTWMEGEESNETLWENYETWILFFLFFPGNQSVERHIGVNWNRKGGVIGVKLIFEFFCP